MGGGGVAPSFGTNCEKGPESRGGVKQRQKSVNLLVTLNSGAVRYL